MDLHRFVEFRVKRLSTTALRVKSMEGLPTLSSRNFPANPHGYRSTEKI